MTATPATSRITDHQPILPARPRIGVLGVTQSLYDEMLPGITARQEAYAHAIAASLHEVADVSVSPAVKNRADAERAVRAFEGENLDGLIVLMLTYGPAMHVAGALAHTRLPVCLANVQPVPEVTGDWDMADLTYNQGIHGAQDTANAMVRAGRPFEVITNDWQSPAFTDAIGRWARAAAAVTRWRELKVAIFGYAMNAMGDIRVDVHTLLRTLGPQVDSVATGDLYAAAEAVDPAAVAQLLAEEDARFDVDLRLSAAEREDHARMQLGIEHVLSSRGYGAYSTHFGAIAEDGRFDRLPLAAAASLMAKGYGFAAEGDPMTAALMSAGRDLFGEVQFTEMYAMDFERDAFLMSHMGEGNWAMARDDQPVRLIKRSLGIAGLEDPPTFLFQYRPGPATLAALLSLPGDRFRLVVAEGQILDSEELPALEMPYGFFRPIGGVRACANEWLKLGGPHHQVLSAGHTAEDWRLFCEATGIEHAVAG
jgi:L-arabinose isomerase